jgi:hypothetical protein
LLLNNNKLLKIYFSGNQRQNKMNLVKNHVDIYYASRPAEVPKLLQVMAK